MDNVLACMLADPEGQKEARRAKRRPEGPKGGPKGPRLEVGPRRGPRFLVEDNVNCQYGIAKKVWEKLKPLNAVKTSWNHHGNCFTGSKLQTTRRAGKRFELWTNKGDFVSCVSSQCAHLECPHSPHSGEWWSILPKFTLLSNSPCRRPCEKRDTTIWDDWFTENFLLRFTQQRICENRSILTNILQIKHHCIIFSSSTLIMSILTFTAPHWMEWATRNIYFQYGTNF